MNKSKIYNGGLPKIFRMVVSGSSSTGKSHYVQDLLENKNGILHANLDKIVYLRGVETEKDKKMRAKFGSKIKVFEGIPSEEILLKACENKEKKNQVLVLEDLDDEVSKSPVIAKFFSAYSHHLQCSIIYTTQNFFKNGPERLSIMRNSTHLILFNINLDETVIRLIAQKIYPKNPSTLVELYEKITAQPFNHLAIFTSCDKELKFRSDTNKTVQTIYHLP